MENSKSFVLNYAFEGAEFILKGRPWSVVKREDEEILVTQSKEIANIPSWAGEDIPIPFEVAREVGKLRRIALKKSTVDNYPCDDKSFEKFANQIKNQKKQGFVIPDDKIDEKEVCIVPHVMQKF